MQVYDVAIGLPMPLPILAKAVRAGFPSPADDFIEEEIDLQRLLISNRPGTFLVRVSGGSMILARLFDGDLAVVNRSLTPRNGDIVVVDIDGERSFKIWMEIEMAALRKEASDLVAEEFWDRVMREIEGVLPENGWVPDHQAMGTHASRLGEKLRREGLATNHGAVLFQTCEHDRGRPQRSVSTAVTLSEATNDTTALVKATTHGVRTTWRDCSNGGLYERLPFVRDGSWMTSRLLVHMGKQSMRRTFAKVARECYVDRNRGPSPSRWRRPTGLQRRDLILSNLP